MEYLVLKGISALDKNEVLELINSLQVRKNAITLVNLITANLPSEMVRLKIEDFDIFTVVKKIFYWSRKKPSSSEGGFLRSKI